MKESHYLQRIRTLSLKRLSFAPQLRGVSTKCNCRSRLYHTDRPVPLRLPSDYPSLLPLVLSSSNLVLPQGPWDTDKQHLIGSRTEEDRIVGKEVVVPFFLSMPTSPDHCPVGFVRPEVVKALIEDHESHIATSPWETRYSSGNLLSVCFAPWVNEGGKDLRSLHMMSLVHRWRLKRMFEDILGGWSDEAYPVYDFPRNSETVLGRDSVAFTIERAALPLFGFPNFGTLLTAYFYSNQTNQTMLWIPRRSTTKRTWPGRLDVTVGGGISHGDPAMSTILRECAEEASLDTNYIKEHIRPVGVLPFLNRSPARWILPGVYYLFDLPLPPDGSIRPRINVADGEVESFELMDPQTVLKCLLEGRFKSSSALALVDFLIRHGFVTEESDPRYVDVCRLLKKELNLPVPWR